MKSKKKMPNVVKNIIKDLRFLAPAGKWTKVFSKSLRFKIKSRAIEVSSQLGGHVTRDEENKSLGWFIIK